MIDYEHLALYGSKPWTVQDRIRERATAYQSKEGARAFVQRCRDDILYYVNTCVDQINPQKKKNKEAPFLPCLRQMEYLLAIKAAKASGKDLATPKARKVGASWMQIIDDTHSFLFEPAYSSIITSYDKTLIEGTGKGNMNTLFEKFDFVYRRLPQFMHPLGYDELDANGNSTGDGKPPYKVDFLRSNPVTGGFIFGMAMTKNFGAGGRGGKAFLDELSRSEFQHEAWVSCGQTSSSRHCVLTPQG